MIDSEENLEACFSCDVLFEPEDQNDRDEGYFCNECINNKEGNR